MLSDRRRGPRRLLAAGSLMVAAAFSGGCSLLFHVDSDQCTTTSDCTARGGAFLTSFCSAGTCVPAEAGSDAGPTPDGGEAGVEAGTPCTTTADCTAIVDPTSAHQEVACNPDTNTCVQLTTDECPLPPLGDYKYAKGVPPIFLGAFATIPQNASPTSDPSYLNYQFAIDEFTNAGGIPAGPGFALRMPVVVVCNNVPTAVNAAMTHLANDLHVPGVVAALGSVTLKTAFATYGFNTPSNLFMVNPFGADSNVTGLSRGNQLWHMLGAPGDVASAYQALMPRIEAYMRANAPWSVSLAGDGGAGRPLRVATVTAQATVLEDLGSAVTNVLTWNNGQTVQQNQANGTYDNEAISDSVLNGTPLTSASLRSSIGSAAQHLAAFKPDVVISFASDEFISVLESLELELPAGAPPPFYVLGPYNAAMPSELLSSFIPSTPSALSRVVGINVAASTDTSVLDTYDQSFVVDGMNPPNTENYYDAMYFAVDSLVGAAGGATAHLTGTDMGAGMLRLLSLAGTPYSMGPADMGHVFSTLDQTSSATVYLDGTLGPPIFSNMTGARVTQGDIYCVSTVTADAGPPSYVFTYDQMRLSPAADGGVPSLTGKPCFTGL